MTLTTIPFPKKVEKRLGTATLLFLSLINHLDIWSVFLKIETSNVYVTYSAAPHGQGCGKQVLYYVYAGEYFRLFYSALWISKQVK